MSDGKRLLVSIGVFAGALAAFLYAAKDVADAAAELKGVCDGLSGDGQAEGEAENLVIDAEARTQITANQPPKVRA